MDVNPELWKRRENGTVEITELPRAEWAPAPGAHQIERRLLCRWHPPYQVTENLPPWYDLCLACDVYENGSHRFHPVGKTLAESRHGSVGLRNAAETQGLSLVASLGGNAILVDRGEVAENLPFTYHEARLFLQHSWHLREYFGRTVKLGRLLDFSAGGRIERGSRTILPENLGLDSAGKGMPWGRGRLQEEGLNGAWDAGLDNPDPEQILRYSLLAAATRNPLFAKPSKTQSLVRLTMFNLDEDTRQLRRKDLRYIAEQIKRSLQDHVDDDREKFDRWIEDPGSNLIRRIEKRKDCRLDRAQVKKAFLELGWQSIKMLGRCVEMQMRAFCNSLPFSLRRSDRKCFRQLYIAHSSFGNLPLILLYERFEFLREAILQMWRCPNDPEAIGIVHRMMHYYSEIMDNVRTSGRLYKRRSNARTVRGRVAREQGIVGDIAAPIASRTSRLIPEVARRLAVARGTECNFDDDDWDAKIISRTDDEVEFDLFCERRQFERTYCVPLAEFSSIARQVAGELDADRNQ